MPIPLLFPLIVGGTGLVAGASIGGATGYTVAKGAESTADALKWAVLGVAGVTVLLGALYVVRKT